MLYNQKSNIFVPIDHVDCFIGLNLDKEQYLISPNESILSSTFLSRFFNRTFQHKSSYIRLLVIEDFKTNLKHCHEKLDEILAQTPLAWNPNTDFLKTRLEFLFSDQWTNKCLDYFTELFTLNIKT